MKKYINEITTEDLHTFCIKHNYFTSGTNKQFSRLFDLCKMGAAVEVLASVIWTSSPGADLKEITDQLNELRCWPIWVQCISENLQKAGFGETEIEIITEAVRTHPNVGKAYKIMD